jgi:hypothetical protein
MHFFRIKIKPRAQRRTSLPTDHVDSPALTGRHTHVPSPSIAQPRFRSNIWQLLPFVGKVSRRSTERFLAISELEVYLVFA